MEHEKCDYVRAVLEGVAMNLDIILTAHRENVSINELVLTGGGARRCGGSDSCRHSGTAFVSIG